MSFTSQDFLGLGADAAVKEQARETLERYTVGSCGPRGFYGTTRKHLELEDDIAAFMRKDQSITYSDATATIASAIPAFANSSAAINPAGPAPITTADFFCVFKRGPGGCEQTSPGGEAGSAGAGRGVTPYPERWKPFIRPASQAAFSLRRPLHNLPPSLRAERSNPGTHGAR